MLNLKPIALVGGTVMCAVGFLLFIPLITEIIYKTESWQAYAVPILLYLIVGGALVITNRNLELKISTNPPEPVVCWKGVPLLLPFIPNKYVSLSGLYATALKLCCVNFSWIETEI